MTFSAYYSMMASKIANYHGDSVVSHQGSVAVSLSVSLSLYPTYVSCKETLTVYQSDLSIHRVRYHRFNPHLPNGFFHPYLVVSWTSPFSILGVPAVLFHVYVILNKHSC